ncbi:MULTISPECIES: hypothetical protein [Halobacteriovorax]|uniref:HPt domain-containing protein n=1 Tax=Halobacteriovorax vibrionivorans TaxID=2152716 RepID=A0ABY0IHY5_9BACT|nr:MULTISPECIES: hypothetical protein [Halobacteriovorax]AYF44872.1 hypothetical protein BALOs_1872 [Halobacteriovorax sp. BALOs_7]RZF20947.1 hypothetical protein DAY19_13260 [Halobacteriovorax vibrionivorans]TGD46047.1 hypothetical protein EP118_13710 [Halobacteriovorax sp. Y22]
MEKSLNQHIQKLLPKFKQSKKTEINHLLPKVATMSEKELREVLHKMAGSFSCYNFLQIGSTLKAFEMDQHLDSKRDRVKKALEEILREL